MQNRAGLKGAKRGPETKNSEGKAPPPTWKDDILHLQGATGMETDGSNTRRDIEFNWQVNEGPDFFRDNSFFQTLDPDVKIL